MRSRAAILHDVGGPWSVEEFEPDPRRTGEVLVEMAAAGLCHSDDQILKGDMSAPNEVLRSLGLPTTFPTSGGHEGSRVVREIGYGVGDFAVGDHVVMSFVPVCGRCRWCASGMEYICDAGIGTLTPGMPTDGTFRHHTVGAAHLGTCPRSAPSPNTRWWRRIRSSRSSRISRDQLGLLRITFCS